MLDKIAAFKTLVESQNPSAPIRLSLTDKEAVELAAEVGADLPQHAKQILEAAALMAALLEQPVPTESDDLQRWAEQKGKISRELWDGLTGSVINGVEIHRKR